MLQSWHFAVIEFHMCMSCKQPNKMTCERCGLVIYSFFFLIKLPWSRFIMLQNFSHLVAYIFPLSPKQNHQKGEELMTSVNFWLSLKEVSQIQVRKFSRSSWIKNSTLLLSPNLNCLRLLLVLSPREMLKSSEYHLFCPLALEPYLKALAALTEDNACLKRGSFNNLVFFFFVLLYRQTGRPQIRGWCYSK